MTLTDLIVEHSYIPGNSVIGPSSWILHSLTPPIKEVIVEGVHSRSCTQDVDSDA